MSLVDRTILRITEPTIEYDNILFEEDESAEASKQREDINSQGTQTTHKTSSVQGNAYPVVQVNTIRLKRDQIASFKLDLGGFIPSLFLSVDDTEEKFLGLDYPKDGDVVSIYIRPYNVSELKPIRLDFDIVDIRFIPGKINSFSFSCILKVPGIFAEECKSYSNNTSFNHLIEVSEELGLGFATNVDETTDSMVRINPFTSKITFINDTVKTSYYNDDSFFLSFIDPYYYLNFIDVNKQFSEEDILEDITINPSVKLDIQKGNVDSEDGSSVPGSLVLTNRNDFNGTENFIKNYGLGNESASVWIDNGYKRYCQYYDIPTSEYNSFFVDPLTTNGSESDKILLKGRANENFYETQIKHKYVGKQYSGENGNMHENFLFSSILNFQNLQEINKMYLNIELETTNFNLYKYQRVPVHINENDIINKQMMEKRNEILGEDQEKGQGDSSSNQKGEFKYNSAIDAESQKKNEFLSGYYVISEIIYIYEKGDKIRQKLKLLRREWPIPAEVKDN